MARAVSRGHSLAEVVVAIFLLGLVVGAVLNLFPTSFLSIEHSEARLQANNLAQAGLEEASREPWPAVVGLTATTETIRLAGRDYRRTLSAAQTSPSLCRLTARVEGDEKGVTRQVEEVLDVAELHR